MFNEAPLKDQPKQFGTGLGDYNSVYKNDNFVAGDLSTATTDTIYGATLYGATIY